MWLASDAGRAEVTREDVQVRDAGITGAPCFILDVIGGSKPRPLIAKWVWGARPGQATGRMVRNR